MTKIKDFLDHWFGYFPSDNEAYTRQFDKVILPIIRRVMPSIIAHDIIGVQPMTSPASDIFSLRVKYRDDIQQQQKIQKQKDLNQLLENTRRYLKKKNDSNG